MPEFLRRLFGKKPPRAFTADEYTAFSEQKHAGLKAVLGPMHNRVGHAIVPFELGGQLDLYYFPNGIAGTGWASMELLAPDGTGPKPSRIGTYEIVMFTRLRLADYRMLDETDTPFSRIEKRCHQIMTCTARYAQMAVLNPGETCEIPAEVITPRAALLFDEYKPEGREFRIAGQRYGLLLCIEVLDAELEYARRHGSHGLLAQLKAAGHWPYSDLDRPAVV